MTIWRSPVLGSSLLLFVFSAPTELFSQHAQTLLTFIGLVIAGSSGILALGRVADAGFATVSAERRAQIARDPQRGTFGAVAIALSLLLLFSCTDVLPPTPFTALTPLIATGLGLASFLTLDSTHSLPIRACSAASLLGLVVIVGIISVSSLAITAAASLAAMLVSLWCRRFLIDEERLIPRTASFMTLLTMLIGLAR